MSLILNCLVCETIWSVNSDIIATEYSRNQFAAIRSGITASLRSLAARRVHNPDFFNNSHILDEGEVICEEFISILFQKVGKGT